MEVTFLGIVRYPWKGLKSTLYQQGSIILQPYAATDLPGLHRQKS